MTRHDITPKARRRVQTVVHETLAYAKRQNLTWPDGDHENAKNEDMPSFQGAAKNFTKDPDKEMVNKQDVRTERTNQDLEQTIWSQISRKRNLRLKQIPRQ